MRSTYIIIYLLSLKLQIIGHSATQRTHLGLRNRLRAAIYHYLTIGADLSVSANLRAASADVHQFERLF